MSFERFFRYPTSTVNYVVNISERYKYCYLMNPKCASTGILRTLQAAEVDGNPSRISDAVHDRSISPLMDFTNCTGSPEQVLTQFFVFSFVRNPYTRILSAYMDKMVRDVPERTRLLPTLGFDPDKPPPPFIDFLKAVQSQRDDWRDIHWTTQSRLLQSNNISYSYIGRFETFATTFPKVLERIGIPPKFHDPSYVPHHATRANDRVAQYIGPKEREVIGAIYYADFNNFAYGFDPAVSSL